MSSSFNLLFYTIRFRFSLMTYLLSALLWLLILSLAYILFSFLLLFERLFLHELYIANKIILMFLSLIHISFLSHEVVHFLLNASLRTTAFLLMCTSCKNPHFYHTLMGKEMGEVSIIVVTREGFEPPAYGLEGSCSIH